MDDGKALQKRDIIELAEAVKQLIQQNKSVPQSITVLEEEIKDEIERLRKHVFRTLDTHQKILFGDGENSRGLIGRQNRVEDRLELFWWAIGVFGTASIYGLVNMIKDLFRKFGG